MDVKNQSYGKVISAAYQPKGDYLTSIPEEYVTEEELNAKGYLTEHQDISNLATKEELSSKADSSAIADMATKTWVGQQGFLTEHQDISQLATKQEVTQGLSGKQDTLKSGTTIKTINGQSVLGEGNIEIQGGGDGIPDAPSDGKKYVRSNGNWVQETTVDTSSFATKSELEGKADSAELDDKLSKTEAQQTYQPKGDYLTAVPEEYVTETELNDKGYATTTQLSDAVADKLTKTQADEYYQATGDYATIEQLSSKADKIEVVSVEGATPTQEIQPNKLYKFGECASLTVTLAAEIPDIYNEYMFEFISGATPTTLNLPQTVKWMGTPTVEANKTYQVSIVNNLAVIGGWSNE